MKLFNLLCIPLFLDVYASNIDFSSCGTGTLSIQDLTVSPYPLQKSVDSTVLVHAQLNQPITNGEYNIVVNLGGLQIYSKSGDLCTLDANICPQQIGEKTFNKSFSIPSLAPSGSYEAKATIHSGDQLVACYTFDFDLN